MKNNEITYHPIGFIHSEYKSLDKIPKSSMDNLTEAEIEIDPKYLESMADLKVGEKYLVLFHFHKSKGYKQTVPMKGVGPMTALFSTHAPNRPNPIGVSVITVKSIDKNIITFNGVDMLDQTPVLDIKSFTY